MGKVKLIDDYKKPKNTQNNIWFLKEKNGPHKCCYLVWREKHKKTISSSGGQGSLLFSFKWLHTYQLTTSRIIKMKKKDENEENLKKSHLSPFNHALWSGLLIVCFLLIGVLKIRGMKI